VDSNHFNWIFNGSKLIPDGFFLDVLFLILYDDEKRIWSYSFLKRNKMTLRGFQNSLRDDLKYEEDFRGSLKIFKMKSRFKRLNLKLYKNKHSALNI